MGFGVGTIPLGTGVSEGARAQPGLGQGCPGLAEIGVGVPQLDFDWGRGTPA